MEKKGTNRSVTTGMLCAVGSAFLYGTAPALARATYSLGSNGANTAFLRCLLSLPLLFALSRGEKHEKLPPRANGKILLAGTFIGATTILLYSSYSFIGSGVATALHFVYPLVVILLSLALYGRHPAGLEIAGLVLGLAGIVCFAADFAGAGTTGVAIALLSGCTYACYIMLSGSRDIVAIPCFTYIFRLTVAATFVGFVYCAASGKLTLNLPPVCWAFCLVLGVADSGLAIVLFQLGVRLAGRARASLFSMFEPLTGMICGIAIFHDPLTVRVAAGCACVLCSLAFTSLSARKDNRRAPA